MALDTSHLLLEECRGSIREEREEELLIIIIIIIIIITTIIIHFGGRSVNSNYFQVF